MSDIALFIVSQELSSVLRRVVIHAEEGSWAENMAGFNIGISLI
jgi:hypothetical protein